LPGEELDHPRRSAIEPTLPVASRHPPGGTCAEELVTTTRVAAAGHLRSLSWALDIGRPEADHVDVAVHTKRRDLERLLAEAEARIDRLTPRAASAALLRGGLIIDIRSVVNCERDGIIPGSIHIPRTVLEWRVDPDSQWRNPYLGDLDQQLVLLCDHGCSSLLAAATLADLGFTRATDIIGGFAAWSEARLPTAQPTACRPGKGEPDGMQPADPGRHAGAAQPPGE
jgi:rhodanese-related sulfurtransferase